MKQVWMCPGWVLLHYSWMCPLILQSHSIPAPRVKDCRDAQPILTKNFPLYKQKWYFSAALISISLAAIMLLVVPCQYSSSLGSLWVPYEQALKPKKTKMQSHRLFPPCAGKGTSTNKLPVIGAEAPKHYLSTSTQGTGWFYSTLDWLSVEFPYCHWEHLIFRQLALLCQNLRHYLPVWPQ